ncbi:nuclear pore complex protein Nup205-like [Tubulanus polymorphus]|uniref:nuclear pore complex protein Nup205-like n=1 Tax=Tubulanus polymorphus TaxID=672921 RepID=UPI003DA68B0E
MMMISQRLYTTTVTGTGGGAVNTINPDARYWNELKELYNVIDCCIFKKQTSATSSIYDLEMVLKKHKVDFSQINCYPGKNAARRKEVQRASTDGISIQGQQGKQSLSSAFIDETLIFSDLFDLNEYAAVELLIAGENQQQYFPGLTRGLVAVLLYYDGKRSLINSLRTLIQARSGHTWTLGLAPDLVPVIMSFTKELFENQLSNKILDHLNKLELTTELERLEKSRGLGNAKHRKQVTDIIEEIRVSLAECLFNWSCQTGMEKTDVVSIIKHLRTNTEINSDGTLNSVTICLLMAVLYSFDVSMLDDESEADAVQKMPILMDDKFIKTIHDEITDSTLQWSCPGVRAVLQFAWSLTLRALSRHAVAQGISEYCEGDEYIAEAAISDGVFTFIATSIVSSSGFHYEEFYVRKIHHLLTEFLVHMPLKVKELRNRGDEVARIIADHMKEGLMPPSNLPRDFEHLLNLIGELYKEDPLNLELEEDFWCPAEIGLPGMSGIHRQFRPPQRQISLHKFVRLAGDLLPPSLYIPYVQMLTGLASGKQSAHHCFNLLKTNGINYGGQASTISWDHFFHSFSQYYASLRQEAPFTGNTSNIYCSPHLRGITPLELEGLTSVLNLVRVIADKDETARISLCENQNWMPIQLFFGLLSCSVPAPLKAELLKTLAAFAKTPEIAIQIWQSLEVSQIVPTMGKRPGQQEIGIHVELDEVESRNEEFPMIRAFLDFISTLIEIPIPAGLGGGYRTAGFQPFFNFIKDSIFLKFQTRAYKDPGEKWLIAAKCLEIFHKLLTQYEILPENFTEQTTDVQAPMTTNKSAGHYLIIHLLNDSPLFKMVMYVVDEAINMLHSYNYASYEGRISLEKSSLYCLQMIQIVLEQQDQFLDALRESGASILATTLDRLLLGINPRSGKPDHLVDVARYIIHNSVHPEHALSAVKILILVCQSSQVQQELVGLITANRDLSEELLHGFVECLEADDPEILNEVIDYDSPQDSSGQSLRSEIRQGIAKLLLQSVGMPSPNIGHYLLGFNLRQAVSKTNLQDPGVLGSPRTCLHSILSILDNGVGTSSGPRCLLDMPRMAELSYHLIYVLCANKETATPTMRYLRTTEDFFYKHAQHLPFTRESVEPWQENLLLNQQSWLLKSIAIELRLTSLNRQRSHTQRLMVLLLDDNLSSLVFSDIGDEDHSTPSISSSFSQPILNLQFGAGSAQTRRKIKCLLSSIGLSKSYPYPDLPLLELFDPIMIEQVIASCTQQYDDGGNYCNVKTLDSLLIRELDDIQFSNTVHRTSIVEEIQNILGTVVKRNGMKKTLQARKNTFEAWSQVVEIILTACPQDLLEGEARQSVLFELLQDLLMEISDENALPELTAPTAGVILTLMANLRQCFLTSQDVTGAGTNTANKNRLVGQKKGSRTLFSSSLQVVLKGLIEYILKTSASQQRVRANLYGALLYCLQIAQSPEEVPSLTMASSTETSGVEKILTVEQDEKECEKLARENLATIRTYGTSFMDVLCRDTCDGHEVIRILAMSSLDAIIQMDKSLNWLMFLQSKGYLQHLVDSLSMDDELLQRMLKPNPEPLRALYMYESKMCLLTKIAMTATGAQSVLRCGIIKQLEQCTSLDMRPDILRVPSSSGSTTEFEGFMPSVLIRYHKIFHPTLKLCLGIMTSLGIENRDAANQVMQFICAHSDVFCAVLRNRSSRPNLQMLQELALVTAVVSRAVAFGDHEYFSEDVSLKIQISRIQHLVISLMPKYCMMGNLLQQVETGGEQDGPMRVAILEIACNLVSFCRAIVSQSATSAQFSKILFAPSLNEAFANELSTFEEMDAAISSVYHPPNLGVVVHYLKQSTDQFFIVLDRYKQTLHKLNSIADLTNDELKELTGNVGSEKVLTQHRQQLAHKRLQQILTHKVKESQLCAYLVENCLFILWRHLDYYFIHCRPSDQGMTLFEGQLQNQSRIRKLQDTTETRLSIHKEKQGIDVPVTKDELNALKQAAVSCINDSIFKKLQEIEQVYTKHHTRFGFTEALIRRLKRLLKLHTST